MELLINRITNLLKIKSIVTMALTAVFCYLCVMGQISADQLLTIFTVVIGFYFGTQAERREQEKVAAGETATTIEEVKP